MALCTKQRNPAVIINRGMSVAKFVCDEAWKKCSKFLAEATSEWPTETPDSTLSNVLELIVYTTDALNCVNITNQPAITRLVESASDWYCLRVTE